MTGRIHCSPGTENGHRRRRFAARISRAALAAALVASLFGPVDAATARDKTHHRGEAAKRAPAEKPPSGQLTIVVSIGNQHVSLYADGAFVARGPVSTGMHGHPTPVGVFTVIQKDRYHRSNIYSLAPMPYMQRITWSGVALHEGVLPGYPASHGCIRMSGAFAVRLWGITKIGARVIVARSDTAPAEIAHSHLFSPRPEARATPVPEPEVRAVPVPQPEPRPELKPAIAPSAVAPPADVVPAAPSAPLPAPGAMPPPPSATQPTDPPVAAPSEQRRSDDLGGGAEPEVAPPATATAPPPVEAPSIEVVKAAADAAMLAEPTRKPGTVSVLVSKKTGRLYVRQNYQPLFDVPVGIREPERPIGTHVYTAMGVESGGTGMRWTVVTMPGDASVAAEPRGARGKRKAPEPDAAPSAARASHTAIEALDRVDMPADAVERVSELLTPGSSLIISDQPMSDETGRDTDFIVLTH
ncbi:MAG TPA: L,D-transpeptidase [Xanthobacteraceae bacterium]|nr:L,D-transpeptidase [Xanthobacteraceae bacterium]